MTAPRASAARGWLDGIRNHLGRHVDISSLAAFRAAFGLLMLIEVGRFFTHGWIDVYYRQPGFHFSYLGFEWVRPWPGVGMYLHFAALGVLAACIALGLWHRLACALFAAGIAYVFVLDAALYLNHLYLICLFAVLLACVPAAIGYSIDAAHSGAQGNEERVPAWAYWVFRSQMGIVYFYSGLAKLNGDWLRGEPMRAWLANRADYAVVGALFREEWVVYLASYGSLLLDVLAVPLLLWQRTREAAVLVLVCFHLMNGALFEIGIFPWLAIAATLLFLPPDWPRTAVRELVSTIRWTPSAQTRTIQKTGVVGRDALPGRALGRFLIAFFVIQLVLPLRHHLYPGDVNWTEEGHRFAWRMKLRDKEGTVRFYASDPGGRRWEVIPSDYLAPHQIEAMSTRPDLIHQFARFLAASEAGPAGSPRITVEAMVSLNDHPPREMIDPTVDLGREPRHVGPAWWIRH